MTIRTLIISAFSLTNPSCTDRNEVNKYLDYVKQSTSSLELEEYKSISEDSIFYVHSERIPKFIWSTMKSYPEKKALNTDLKNIYGVDTIIVMKEMMMMFLHLDLNNKQLSKRNLRKQWKHYVNTEREFDRRDNARLASFIDQNYNDTQIGDSIKLIFDVETQKDSSRRMTFGSVYHMYNPKALFDDSLIVNGIVTKKGPAYIFDADDSTDHLDSSLEIQLIMTEISDTTISTRYTGTTPKLQEGKLFNLDLNLYGCRHIKSVNDN